MTVIRLIISDSYGYGGSIHFHKIFDDDLCQKFKTIKKGKEYILDCPYTVQFDIFGPCFMRKYNKITDEDFGYIIEQMYCEWRFA